MILLLLVKLGELYYNQIMKTQNGQMPTIILSDYQIMDNVSEVDEYFEDQCQKGLEGVMAKKLDGVYQAGSRNFNWIKYKKSYAGKLSDTIDCVVMGYDFGQGKRAGFGIGDFLIGVLDSKKEKYVTVAKIGTGLTDEEWKELKIKAQRSKIPAKGWSASGGKEKPAVYEVDKAMNCDIWVEPKIVVEIRADEVTRSPVHTAGRVMGPSKSGSAQEVKTAGFALRFPRLERFRDDKNPEDATQLSEVEKMFKLQNK
jgi:DNA ligase-1